MYVTDRLVNQSDRGAQRSVGVASASPSQQSPITAKHRGGGEDGTKEEPDTDSKPLTLTLMEEILLLELRDREVLVNSYDPTGDVLLDEALKHIKSTDPPEDMSSWITLLTGETWNPLKRHFQMRNVREHLVESLVGKGVLSTEKLSFLLFEMTIHPLTDSSKRPRLVQCLQDSLLEHCTNDWRNMSRRMLALILLAHAAGVLENALTLLSDDHYNTASTHLHSLLETDPDLESTKDMTPAEEVIWAMLVAFNRS
ncbi:Golgi phosphoprotein 3-like [Carassius carassius]|uniref:Golgi phosphoprotein 3-like n=1 Tax=Carassius carassius TaxID=217509 RepID=UPI00286849CC|nr:Golgi phosphoprotein 3-like [Carassius carassius]